MRHIGPMSPDRFGISLGEYQTELGTRLHGSINGFFEFELACPRGTHMDPQGIEAGGDK